MTNIANLYPQHFSRILSGEKRTEWRARKRPDPRLEAVERGEPIVLLECGTSRAIRATVAGKLRFDYDGGGHVYGIRLGHPELFICIARRVQGWRRIVNL